MKSVVNRVTWQQLKRNKKRTLITVVGIALSVAMLTATATVAVSFLDMMRRNEIASAGDWHAQYEDVDPEQIKAIRGDARTESVLLSRRLGYAVFHASQDERRPYLYLREYNDAAFQYFPIQVKEGRLPQRTGELIITEDAAKNGGALLGELLPLEIGSRYYDAPMEDGDPEGAVPGFSPFSLYHPEHIVADMQRTYTVVGVMYDPGFEGRWEPGYTAIGYLDESQLSSGDTVTASVRMHPVNRAIYQDGRVLADRIGADVTFHSELLQYSGVFRGESTTTALYGFVAVILLVILIGSVALIYNAFAISLSERSRYMGMLASVGATRRQKRNSVLFEGVVLGALSIPLGLLAGILGIGVTFRLLSHAVDSLSALRLVVSPLSIGMSVLLAAVTILISAWNPARRASKIAPIDAIRQSRDIKIDRRAVKTSRFASRLFGMEGELALKNLKRNRKRYRTTIFSLVISILLFLTASYGTDTLAQTFASENPDINCDIKISSFWKESTNLETNNLKAAGKQAEAEALARNVEQEQRDVLLQLAQTQGVTEYCLYQRLSFDTVVPNRMLVPAYKNVLGDPAGTALRVPVEAGDQVLSAYVVSLNDQAFSDYCAQIGVDAALFSDPSQYRGILYNHLYTVYLPENETELRRIDTAKLDVTPDSALTLGAHYYGGNETQEKRPDPVIYGPMGIAVATDQLPLGGQQDGTLGLQLFVPESMLLHMAQAYGLTPFTGELSLNVTDTAPLHEAVDVLEQTMQYSQLNLADLKADREEGEQMILVIRTFAYGFVALLSAIGIANVFNTISTSVALRRREFAMLQSVGMTPGGFRRMLSLESLFYGFKALLYGIPLGLLVILLLYSILHEMVEAPFEMPWMSLLCVVIAVFLIVGTAMFYSNRKVKGETIVDALREENI